MGIYKFLGACCSPLAQRYIVATAVMGIMAVMYVQRVAFNLAITEMTFKEKVAEEKSEVCGTPETNTTRVDNRVAEFHWSKDSQARLLSIFYIGYIISHIPGGILSDKYGPKRVLGYGLLVSGICTGLTPVCARFNEHALEVLRFVLGLAQGPLFPGQSSFVARWSVKAERDLMNAYMNVGSTVGAVVGQWGTGYLIHSLNRWDDVFYIFGGLSIPMYLFYVVFAHDSIHQHPFLSRKERETIRISLETELVEDVEMQYGKILTSLPVWAMVIAGFGHDWAFYIIITVLPQYMAYVLLFDVNENGALLCLPNLSMLAVSLIAPSIATTMRKVMSKTMQCKLYFLICNQGAAFCFLAATFAGCNRLIVVVLFCSAMGVLGLIYSCVRVVQVDMAPNVAGFLMAVMNGIGGIGGFFVPELFSFVQTSNTVEGWRNGFIFSAVVISITTVIFLIWGSSEVQEWNFPSRAGPTAEEGEEGEEENSGKQK